MSENSNQSQSSEYKRTNEIEYVADLPGAVVEEDRLYIVVDGGEIDVIDRAERKLGETDVTDRSEREVGKVVVKSGEIDVTDRGDREAGRVAVKSLPDAVSGEDGLVIAEPITVTQEETVTIEASQLDKLASTVTDEGRIEVDHPTVIDVSSRENRNLGEVEISELPDADEAAWNGASIEAGGTKSKTLSAPGADQLRGRISSSGPITVKVDWLATGEAVFTDTIGEESATIELDETVIAPRLSVTVRNTSDSSRELNGVVYLA